MKVTKEQKPIEPRLTPVDRDRIWELFFGNKWSIHRIAQEYHTIDSHIISVIDTESERRWREQHPHEINRISLHTED